MISIRGMDDTLRCGRKDKLGIIEDLKRDSANTAILPALALIER